MAAAALDRSKSDQNAIPEFLAFASSLERVPTEYCEIRIAAYSVIPGPRTVLGRTTIAALDSCGPT
jgi:hypothetical protein